MMLQPLVRDVRNRVDGNIAEVQLSCFLAQPVYDQDQRENEARA